VNAVGRWLRMLKLLLRSELQAELMELAARRTQIERLRARFPSARIDARVRLLGDVGERITLAAGCSILEGTLLSCGDAKNGFGAITVGEGTWIGQYNNLRAGGGELRIGANCLISQFCTLVASNHGIRAGQPIQSQPPDPRRRGVTLGDDVWLGAGVAVMPGVSIGHGAVIGANSVVTRAVPDGEVWSGAPARQMGTRT